MSVCLPSVTNLGELDLIRKYECLETLLTQYIDARRSEVPVVGNRCMRFVVNIAKKEASFLVEHWHQTLAESPTAPDVTGTLKLMPGFEANLAFQKYSVRPADVTQKRVWKKLEDAPVGSPSSKQIQSRA